MKYIDTKWEKRNLGVESGKLIIDVEDTIESIQETLQCNEKEYYEADVPVGCYGITSFLEEHGFRFMETSIELKCKASEVSIPRTVVRFVEHVSYEKSTDDEWKIISDIILSGEMFVTDKISLNPRFGYKNAGFRYRCWADDLLANGCQCFSIKYMNTLVGFEISRCLDKNVEFLLGGGFPNSGTSTGLITVVASYNYWTAQDISIIKTNVSANNLAALKLHEMFGMKVVDMRNIFVK